MKGFAHNLRDFRHWCTNEGALGSEQPLQFPRNHIDLVAEFMCGYQLYLFRRLAVNIDSNQDNSWILNEDLITALLCYCCVTNYHKFSSLKQHSFIVSQLGWWEVYFGLAWVLCWVSHRAEIKTSARLRSWKSNHPLRPQLWAEFISLAGTLNPFSPLLPPPHSICTLSFTAAVA